MINEDIYIKSRDVYLFTKIRGNLDSSNILITLHGGPGSSCEPLSCNETFQDFQKDFIVVYFDQRGCGKSNYDLLKKLSIEDLAYDIHSVVVFLKKIFISKKVYLLGCSFGGELGFIYLRNYPQEIEKYIASSPSIYFSEEDVNKGLSLLTESYQSKVPLSILKHSKNINFTSININNFLNSIKDIIFSDKCTSMSLRYTWAMTPWFFNQIYSNDFLKIKIPTFILHGSNDNMFDINTIKKGFINYSNSLISFSEFENCGHSLFNDNKEYFLKQIREFINKGEV